MEKEKAASTSDQHKETNPEVSLPGSDGSSVEQSAILQATEEKIDKIKENPTDQDILLKQHSSEKPQSHNDVNDVNDDYSDKNLVSNFNKTQTLSQLQPHLVITTPTPTSTPSPIKDCKFDSQTGEVIFPDSNQDNIFDIESHLIETYNELFPNEESVGINELPPIEDELQVGCSKVETNDNVRTVIEVQPAEVVTKKPIEKVIETDAPLQTAQIFISTELSNEESNVNKEEIERIAKKLIQDIEEEVVHNWENIPLQQNLAQILIPKKEEEVVNEKQTQKENLQSFNEENVDTEYEKQEVEKEKIKVHCDEVIVNKDQQHSKQPTSETTDKINENTAETKLSEVVDQQLSEVNTILDFQTRIKEHSIETNLQTEKHSNFKIVSVPSPKTASEEEERKLFIESLPPLEIHGTTQYDAEKLALDCKREYYQSLKKYLVQNSTDKPPVPLQTYRWEDLRRAKERGGYPWTHLYKRPLGPDEEPEIVLMLRKSQEIRFTSESPKSNKKVRIDDHVSIQETVRYIQELSQDEHNLENLPHTQTQDLENYSLQSESFSSFSDSVLTTGKQPKKPSRFSKVRRLFRRRRYGARQHDDAQSLPDSFTNTSLQHSLEQVPQPESQTHLKATKQVEEEIEKKNKNGGKPIYVHLKSPRCFPIMKKIKSMADRQKKRLHIKRIHLGKDNKIVLNEETKILKLKNSPKSQRSDIPHFIEKQDSDDVLEIVQLDESPSRKRRDDDDRCDNGTEAQNSSIVKPEEIIEINNIESLQAESNGATDAANEISFKKVNEVDTLAIPPKKAPRLHREHVYEEIDQPDETEVAAEELKFILDATSVEAIKQSLVSQDTSAVKEVTLTNKNIPLDRMGSSEEESIVITDHTTPERKSNTLLAPISSIDSASSDEDRSKLHLQPVTEEETEQELEEVPNQPLQVNLSIDQETVARTIKKETSPAPSEKKVTFSHVEDEAEPHREDIELSAKQLEATKEATKWKNTIR